MIWIVIIVVAVLAFLALLLVYLYNKLVVCGTGRRTPGRR